MESLHEFVVFQFALVKPGIKVLNRQEREGERRRRKERGGERRRREERGRAEKGQREGRERTEGGGVNKNRDNRHTD